MLWFSPLFIVFFLYIAVKYLRGRTTLLYLFGMLGGWIISLPSFFFYILQHNYYYRVVSRYFLMDSSLRRGLSSLNIPYDILARGMNIGTVMVVYYALMFSLSYCLTNRNLTARWQLGLAVVPFLEVLLYDPALYQYLYKCFVHSSDSAIWLERMQSVANHVTVFVNLGYLSVSMFFLLRHWILCRISAIRVLNLNVFAVFGCFIVLFTAVFGKMPIFWVQANSLNGFLLYNPMPLPVNPAIFEYIAYGSLVLGIAMMLVLYFICSNDPKQSDQMKIYKHLNEFGVLFSMIAHTLKNHILAFDEELYELKEFSGSREEFSLKVEALRMENKYFYDLITNLNMQVKKQRLEMGKISLTELCYEILEENRSLYGNEVMFSGKIEENILCYADNEKLRECVQNLINNGIEAIEGNEKRIWINLTRESMWAVLEIRDNGKGLTKTEQEAIFQPFYSTKLKGKNWGMGLSICNQIILGHSGRLMVESQVGEGSSFKILLSTMY